METLLGNDWIDWGVDLALAVAMLGTLVYPW